MFFSNQKAKEKREMGDYLQRVASFVFFRARRLGFSLKYREIRSSAVVETRRKATLRGETYAWVPDLMSLDKLREVGVSPYLCFILCLSTLLMFVLNEVVRGRLIDPKSWDRIV